MAQTVNRETIILERLQSLTPQQQQSVLDFIEFLQFKERDRTISEEESEEISMLSAAQEFIGCLDSGVGDLSVRKKELKKGYKAVCKETLS
ncbi:hypothetical protein [Spirulina sp. 06S082]|uniref:hypothetical protein n=1 Tax=Spirulina sp. 06S082 TaxID=3110248 RepID=UPI002B1F178C|nr:hypothetical protein [Spirulina sp. 06S082]MEA5467557.1 hypothetical protein [Spirulina sp. 06S082]